MSQSLERAVRGGRERELCDRYTAELAAHGVERDADEVWNEFRVSIAFCLIYGVASYAEYENLPGEGQAVLETVLRRSTAGIVDVDAIAAARAIRG